jgi:DNA-damage-inducible protein J
MAQVNIRVDDQLKEQGERLFNALGMNLTTAINIFISQSVREGRIPFMVTTKPDPFYSEANMKVLLRSIQDANEGKLAKHDLIEV